MPLAELYFDPAAVSPVMAGQIAKRLTEWVSVNLSVDEADGQLSPEDVEVRVRTKGPHDVTNYHIEITVWAKHYPAREALLDEATARIIQALHGCNLPPRTKSWVYILLSPAGWLDLYV